MEFSEKDLLAKTNSGLNIYAHILRQYYPEETVLRLAGKVCDATKNPFFENSLTLQIYNENGQYLFKDQVKKGFEGSAFTFASYHYNLNGKELLQKLNEEMHLYIGENNWYKKNVSIVSGNVSEKILLPPKFSYFKRPVTNVYPEKEVSLLDAYQILQNPQLENKTIFLRSLENPKAARKCKAEQFDYVTFSGIFSKRSDQALLKHSGLIAIDFDHVDQVAELKNQLLEDKYFETELLFTSPSGDGIKWIISIDLVEVTHKEYFQAVSAYIEHNYKLKIDSAGKDVSRACFLPYDNEAYINPKYLPKC